jgi:hypothetical protein
MKLDTFATTCKLPSLPEVEKVAHLAFYKLKVLGGESFALVEVADWFHQLNLSRPNPTRLAQNMVKSRAFIRVPSAKGFKLHAKKIEELNAKLPGITVVMDSPPETSSVLPSALYTKTRGYIELLSKQINTSYETACYDATAILMRRMIEILLILTFREIGEADKICDAKGQYDDLTSIINKALPNPKFGLSKQSRECLDKFRVLGNFSAHRIEYNCKRTEIQAVAHDFRAVVEELLYKSGIHK